MGCHARAGAFDTPPEFGSRCSFAALTRMSE